MCYCSLHIDLHILYDEEHKMQLMVRQHDMYDLQDTWNEVPQLNFFTKDQDNK